MSNRNLETPPALNSQALWAPILLEPMIGSGERVAVAVVGCNADGDREFLPLVNPKTARRLLSGSSRLRKGCRRSDHRELQVCPRLRRGAQVIGNRLWRASFWAPFRTLRPRHWRSCSTLQPPWPPSSIVSLRVEANIPTARRKCPGSSKSKSKCFRPTVSLVRNFNVLLPLGDHYEPAAFTFLSADFAANIVTLAPSRLNKSMEDARAKLWTLSLLDDAPNYLFRPQEPGTVNRNKCCRRRPEAIQRTRGRRGA